MTTSYFQQQQHIAHKGSHIFAAFAGFTHPTNQFEHETIIADTVHSYKLTVFLETDRIFQQDNVTCHTTRNVQHWLEKHDQDLQALPWPL